MYAFYKKYFLINLNEYPNIGFDFPITVFMFCFLIAMIITTVVVNIKRSRIELIIRQLIRHDATDEENAKTLSELRIDNKAICRLLSKEGGQLGKMVRRVGQVKLSYEEYMEKIKSKDYKEEKIDFENARFYITTEGEDRAKRVLALGSASIINTVLFCVLLVAVYICLSLLMPGILSAIDTYLGNFSK